jgi:hypothetical protein
MNDSLSLQEFTLISSYLDDRLTPDQKALVEARIEKDSLFRASLEEIRYTRSLLRSLPRKRAPRNFTLSAGMVPQRRTLRLQPVFGFTSAIAAALTILIFAGSQWVPGFLNAKSSTATMVAMQSAPESTPQDTARSFAAATAVPPLILWNGGAYGMGGGGDFGSAAEGIGGGGGLMGPAPLSPTATAPAVTAEELAKANPSDLILGIAPQAEQGAELPAPAETPAPILPPAPWSTAAILETVLGSLAVITAVLAFLLRRRS